MQKNHPFQDVSILQTEMDRKDFLRYTGIGMLGVLGIGSIIKSIQAFLSGNHEQKSRGSGYGGRPYGL